MTESGEESKAAKSDFQRLPKSVVPLRYGINIKPDLNAFTFEGTVDIDIMVQEPVQEIKMNAQDLQIHDVTLTLSSGTTVQPSEINLQEAEESLTLPFADQVPEGKHQLKISFTGALNDYMKGFYRTKYLIDGEERYAAVTQFESTDARRAFPCWDEPAIKARFDVTITAPADRVVLSNMPVAQEEPVDDGHKRVTFETTPIMSTYLLAFVVGEYDYIEDTTSEGRIAIRVFVPVGKKAQGQFAMNMAKRTLPFYEEWFGIRYPLPKLDLIAIPDFSAGAMENWGLVTYRETALLVDPDSSSLSTKQWVAMVVNHELAHQWFGNIVTMEWWTHLWLNEGFASWMEYFATDQAYPEWKMWNQFACQDMRGAFDLDSLRSSHPIEVPVAHPDEIDEIFDDISYAKGCAVIRMLYGFLGEESFKKGLHAYLTEHQYANAETEDLWHALAQASGRPVKEMMDTWTKQMGYPTLTVESIPESNPPRIKIKQARFLASGTAHGEEANSQWHVPISVIGPQTQASDVQSYLLREEETELEVPTGSWIKLNAGQTGFFRVCYASSDLRSGLEIALRANQLENVPDRLGIQSDAMALARAGVQSTVDALSLITAYVNETDFTVWSDLSANLNSFLNLLRHEESCQDSINAFGRRLYQKVGERVGWDAAADEDVLTPQLRALVLRQLGRFGDEETVKQAQARLAHFLEDRSSLSPDLRATVYTTALQYGDESVYESILQLMRSTDFQEEKNRCMRSLGAVSDEKLLQRTLDLAISGEIRSQDAVSVICSVARNWQGRELAWKFLQENWEKLSSMYKRGSLFDALIDCVVSQFSSEEKAVEIEKFFEARNFSCRPLEQALETIRTNAAWLARSMPEAGDYLQSVTF